MQQDSQLTFFSRKIKMKQKVNLLCITHDAMELIEQIGRVSYQSKKTNTKRETEIFIETRIKEQHFGLFEHAHATFRFITSRAITHELVRHRLCSFIQESTRYCSYKSLDFISNLPINSSGFKEFEQALKKYKESLESQGLKNEDIRDIFPACLKAEIVMTANFRQWMHVLKLRYSNKAHPMMTELMGMVYDILHSQYPFIFSLENLKLGW